MNWTTGISRIYWWVPSDRSLVLSPAKSVDTQATGLRDSYETFFGLFFLTF